jgi:hypothetical protein
MEKERRNGVMVQSMKVIFVKTKDKGKESFIIKMEISI